MRIKDILSPESMIMDLKATTKEEAINEMADLEVATGIVNNKEKFVESIWAREKEGTTGIGEASRCHTLETNTSTRLECFLPKVKRGLTTTHLMVNQSTSSS